MNNEAIDIERVTIRYATVKDAAAIASVYNFHVDDGGSTFDNAHWSPERIAEQLPQELPNVWFVAEQGKDHLGWASVRRYSARFGYRYTCESAIYLDPISYGTGVADALQNRIEAHCIDQGIHHAVAKIVTDNVRSIAFHLRHGYEEVGVQREVGRMDGKWVDVTILQRIFE